MTIRSCRDADTEAHFNDEFVARFRSIERVARYKLLVLDAATDLRVLSINRGNHREALKHDRTALRLGRYFGIDAEFWLRLQASYDIRTARRQH